MGFLPVVPKGQVVVPDVSLLKIRTEIARETILSTVTNHTSMICIRIQALEVMLVGVFASSTELDHAKAVGELVKVSNYPEHLYTNNNVHEHSMYTQCIQT